MSNYLVLETPSQVRFNATSFGLGGFQYALIANETVREQLAIIGPIPVRVVENRIRKPAVEQGQNVAPHLQFLLLTQVDPRRNLIASFSPQARARFLEAEQAQECGTLGMPADKCTSENAFNLKHECTARGIFPCLWDTVQEARKKDPTN